MKLEGRAGEPGGRGRAALGMDTAAGAGVGDGGTWHPKDQGHQPGPAIRQSLTGDRAGRAGYPAGDGTRRGLRGAVQSLRVGEGLGPGHTHASQPRRSCSWVLQARPQTGAWDASSKRSGLRDAR